MDTDSGIADDNIEYSTLEYWNKRYENNKQINYDWFKNFDQLQSQLGKLVPNKNSSILHLGCGNSLLGPDMYSLGYHSITNIDYSSTVIESMKLQFKDIPGLEWVVGDIFELDKLNRKYDVALDKGTMDALLALKYDPWDPSEEILEHINAYISQIYSTLLPQGRFIHVTFAQPHFRKMFFTHPGFRLIVHKLCADGGLEYFCYELIKRQ